MAGSADSITPTDIAVTWRDLARVYLPGLSDQAADAVLWELTGYPLVHIEDLRADLARLAEIVRPAEDGWEERLSTEFERADPLGGAA